MKKSDIYFYGDSAPLNVKTEIELLSLITANKNDAEIDVHDQYCIGGAVAELEAYFARLLDKECAYFLPTGTLANHLAVRRLASRWSTVLVSEQSHLYQDSGQAVEQLSGLKLQPLAPNQAYFDQDQLYQAVEQLKRVRVPVPIDCISIESPVRRHHGVAMPIELMQTIRTFCLQENIKMHLDGARLLMLCAARRHALTDYTRLFDSVYISLYKYLGAPFGAILAGSKSDLKNLEHERRMFGGSLNQAALSALLALHQTPLFLDQIKQAFIKADDLFEAQNCQNVWRLQWLENGSNILILKISETVPSIADFDVEKFRAALAKQRIWLKASENKQQSLFFLTLNTSFLNQTNDEIIEAFNESYRFAIKK